VKTWWTRPWLVALAAGAAILAVALLPPLWQAWRASGHGAAPKTADDAHGLPWQIDVRPGGATRVFGLTLGESPLAAAGRGDDDDVQVALVARGDEPGALEAYVERFHAGFVDGRLVIAAAADEAQRRAWRTRSTQRDPGADGTWRHRLAPADLAAARQAPITGLTFIPAAQLDAATVAQRFGEPAERVRTGTRLEHWLYPERGLAITIDAEGREVLQYVALSEFETRLRAPLTAVAR